ncbi:MAG: SUMF1/EgtB/PvdO family nonheme iron enzyme [Planctomycetes bacterium]|nr:SUMF1/EgtB/PvdO family nonheme iron enzyme [Planctomycetota bacterium]
MGVVLRARDRESGREVALKIVQGELSERRRERFLREGEIAARLRHPGIVTVHSAGLAGGRPYLSYELIEGARTLAEAFQDMDLRDRVRCLRDAAAAIGHAHSLGIVHRDLKPDNVLVDRDDRVRVTDFGLATARDLDRLTATGTLLGTPHYMSPEQLSSQTEWRSSTDVWSLGIMLYESLAGELPFAADSFLELGLQIARATPQPLRDLAPSVPAALEAITRRALRKEPGTRYADGAALAAALSAWLEGRTTDQRRFPWPVVVAVLGTVAAVAGFLTVQGGDPDLPPRRAVPEADGAVQPARRTGGASELPAWLVAIPAAERPPWPLPKGLCKGEAVGEYVWSRDSLVFVWIPAGVARLGATDVYRASPPSVATFQRGFFLGKYELTRRQYLQFCHRTNRRPPAEPFAGVWGELGDDWPMVNVSWMDAQAYCESAGLRLPTENEWEYAARGHDGRSYPWGSERTPSKANLLGPDGSQGIAPVGSTPGDRSPFGCMDMAGNVCEWTAGTPVGGRDERWVRGGDYMGPLMHLAGGHDSNGNAGGLTKGFRVVLAAGS